MSQTKAKTKKRVLEPREYRLLKYQPLTFELKSGRDHDLIVFDDTPGVETNRAIRHCKNEKSIFVDEQSDKAVVNNIIFTNGTLMTEAQDVITQDFLNAHPSNGKLFEMIDDAADARQVVDEEELILDIKQAIRNKAKEKNGEETLRVVVSVLISDVSRASKMSLDELKNEAYYAVDENPHRFCDDSGEITIFDDSDITRKAVAQQAFISGVITLSPDAKRIIWGDNKATICVVPVGKNHIEYFSTFLETEEGLTVMKEIDKRG